MQCNNFSAALPTITTTTTTTINQSIIMSTHIDFDVDDDYSDPELFFLLNSKKRQQKNVIVAYGMIMI